jgi:hypothetical protein
LVQERGSAVEGCLEACRRGLFIVHAIEARQYECHQPGHSSIGVHLRHCIDHLASFFYGLETGTIDYDARRRDPDIETNSKNGAETLSNYFHEIESIDESRLGESILVRQTVCPERPPLTSESTIERELTFVSAHSIHHIAIIELLTQLGGFPISDDLGIAYSTAVYRDSMEKPRIPAGSSFTSP